MRGVIHRLLCGLRRHHEWKRDGEALICRRCNTILHAECLTPPRVSDTLAAHIRRA